MPMINGDLSSCSDTSDISDDVPNSTYRSRNDICRDYLRNVCKRGDRCKYRHPSSEEAKSLGRQAQYTFCHDYQNSGCHRPNCKFMHCTRDEEDYYKQTGINFYSAHSQCKFHKCLYQKSKILSFHFA